MFDYVCLYFDCVRLCFSGQLKASNVELMEHAVQAMQNLAQQCSDPAAIQDLVKHLFSILGGERNFIHILVFLVGCIRHIAGVGESTVNVTISSRFLQAVRVPVSSMWMLVTLQGYFQIITDPLPDPSCWLMLQVAYCIPWHPQTLLCWS